MSLATQNYGPTAAFIEASLLFEDYPKFVGFNPDVSRTENPLTPGNERYDYPTAKSIIFGINLGF